MSAKRLAGRTAAALTLMTFVCRDMQRLRMLAIGANLAFIAYGASAGPMPVLVLHTLLAPVRWHVEVSVDDAQAKMQGLHRTLCE